MTKLVPVNEAQSATGCSSPFSPRAKYDAPMAKLELMARAKPMYLSTESFCQPTLHYIYPWHRCCATECDKIRGTASKGSSGYSYLSSIMLSARIMSRGAASEYWGEESALRDSKKADDCPWREGSP